MDVGVDVARQDEFVVTIDHASSAFRGGPADSDDSIAVEDNIGVSQNIAECGIDDGPPGENNFLGVTSG